MKKKSAALTPLLRSLGWVYCTKMSLSSCNLNFDASTSSMEGGSAVPLGTLDSESWSKIGLICVTCPFPI